MTDRPISTSVLAVALLTTASLLFAGDGAEPVGNGCKAPLTIVHPRRNSAVANLSKADLRLLARWQLDLRQCMADLCGVTVLSPDQEKHVEALNRYPRVAAMGGTGVGKSYVQGVAARCLSAVWPSKVLFGGPKLEQAAKLSWLEFQRAHDAAVARNLAPGGKLGSYDWQGPARDWFAAVMALSDRNNAASVKGMLHAQVVAVVLDELEGVAPEVRDALDAGTTQDGAHYWIAFNPVSPDDAAGRFWAGTPEAGRVHYSAIDAAEWQARTGHRIPGMPTLDAIKAKWAGRENEPLYYTSVLGEFPPESATWVVVPQDWYDKCRGEFAPTDDDRRRVGVGVDTAGGRSENVIAVVVGRCVKVEWHSREIHQTPRLVAEVKAAVQRYGNRNTPIAVDIVGQGGKGVCDQLRADGYNAVPFQGGGAEFNGQRDPAELTADLATWAWFNLRDACRSTIEGKPSIVLPADDVLRTQLARRYEVKGDRRYKLVSKDSANSPDRGDAVAMAWLAATAGDVVEFSRTVTLAEVAPDLALADNAVIGERW